VRWHQHGNQCGTQQQSEIVIIEFIGAPGAGKTTLLPTVIECLRERGIRAFTVVDAARPLVQRTRVGRVVHHLAPASLRRPLLWRVFLACSMVYRLRFCAEHPRLVWLVWWSQMRRPRAADVRERKVLHWYFRFVGYYAFLRAHLQPDEALIVDEGFAHRVVQLFASGVEAPDPQQIAAYVDLAPPPDLLVHVQASPQLCEERIHRRGLWERFQGKDPAEIGQFVANAHTTVQLTVEQSQRRNWCMIQVDNGDAQPSTAQEALRRTPVLKGAAQEGI
jgi:thymidylate kinase